MNMEQLHDEFEYLWEQESPSLAGVAGLKSLRQDNGYDPNYYFLNGAWKGFLMGKKTMSMPSNKAQPIPTYGDHFEVDDFKMMVNNGVIIPREDGSGYWATETHYDYRCSILLFQQPAWATHVMWFNK